MYWVKSGDAAQYPRKHEQLLPRHKDLPKKVSSAKVDKPWCNIKKRELFIHSFIHSFVCSFIQ